MSTHKSRTEKYIGRPLYTSTSVMVRHPEFKFCQDVEEVVHHIDGDRTNNELSNLYVFRNNGRHMDFHQRVRTWAIGLCGKTLDQKIEYLKTFPDLHSNLDELKELHKRKATLSYYLEQESKPCIDR